MIIEQDTPSSERPAAPRISRGRAVVIGAVAVLAVAIGLVLGSVLVAGSGATLARAGDYVPRDAVMYVEVRLDLPGDQRGHLRSILDRFPGVEADDVLTDALAATLDEALADGEAPFDYSGDIAPWFDGTVAMALLDYPLSADPSEMTLPTMVAMFGTRDPAAATDLADRLRGELEAEGAGFASAEHRGVTVWSIQLEEQVLAPMAGVGFAYAVTGDQLVLGNGSAAVEEALDAEASGGARLAEDDDVSRLLAGLPEERIGTSIVNTEAMLASMREALESAQPGLSGALAPYLDAVPAISVGAVSLASDALLFDGHSALPEGPLAPEDATRSLAARVPGDAILYLDGGNVGSSLEQVIAATKASIAADPMAEEGLAALDQVEAALGAELEELVAWIGDGAMAAGWDGDEPYFGLVLDAADPDAATRRLAQLRALAELAASDPSAGIEISTEMVAGTEVVTFGLGGPMSDPVSVPFEAVVQYAVDGDTVLFGVGDRFVPTALTLDPDRSLASSERYETAVGRLGGPDNAGTLFVDLAALRAAVETAVGADPEPKYEMVRPNLEPFDYLASVTRVDGERLVSRIALVLR